MRLRDAERVHEAQHRAGEIAERVLAVEALGRAAVARHVRNDEPEALGQGWDVADEIGGAGRARPAAVQHEQSRALADLYDEDVAAGCPDDSAARRLDGRNGIHACFLPRLGRGYVRRREI